ncbi:MAG TPA: hypothetical protein VH143_33490 [Kofleriaceae bacterium]|nr:hypothetical protein [Kofleriaceae bacterium]
MRAAAIIVVFVASSSHADPIGMLASSPLAERGLALGTALTVPAGDVELSGRAAVGAAGVADVATGLTATTELWVEAAIGTAADHSYALGLKQVIVHRRTWQLALEGAARHLTESDSDPYDPVGTLSFGPSNGRADAFALAAIASACADGCRALFTAGVTAAVMPASSAQSAALLYAWLDASYGGEHVRGIFELAAFPVRDGELVGVAGVRAGWRHVAFELGLGYAGTEPSPIVLPILGVAYRP